MRILSITAKPTPTPKAGSKTPSTPRKPSKPADIDCEKDHKVEPKDDNTLTGTLVVKSCHATRFARKPSRCTNVGNKFTSVVHQKLAKAGITDKNDLKIVGTSGDKKQTVFTYSFPCAKAQRQTVIDSLKDACKDKDLHDTVTKENEASDESNSGSDSDEHPPKTPSGTKEPHKPEPKDKDHTGTTKAAKPGTFSFPLFSFAGWLLRFRSCIDVNYTFSLLQ